MNPDYSMPSSKPVTVSTIQVQTDRLLECCCRRDARCVAMETSYQAVPDFVCCYTAGQAPATNQGWLAAAFEQSCLTSRDE